MLTLLILAVRSHWSQEVVMRVMGLRDTRGSTHSFLIKTYCTAEVMMPFNESSIYGNINMEKRH